MQIQPTESIALELIAPNDLVLLYSARNRREFIVRMEPDAQFQNNYGVIDHNAIIGKRWGETILTHLGHPYMLLMPSLDQLIRDIRRNTQIVYPKDIGYILMKMNIGPGTRVVEAGTGSGGLTLALARMVGPTGHIYTYEAREDMFNLARKNLMRMGLADVVTFTLRDIVEGFNERSADALFLDVREPWLFLEQAHAALKGGGFFGTLLPTTEQVTEVLYNLGRTGFGFVEVEELLVRPYKPNPGRLRPADRMIAHTGYLVFARALLNTPASPTTPKEEDDTPSLDGDEISLTSI